MLNGTLRDHHRLRNGIDSMALRVGDLEMELLGANFLLRNLTGRHHLKEMSSNYGSASRNNFLAFGTISFQTLYFDTAPADFLGSPSVCD